MGSLFSSNKPARVEYDLARFGWYHSCAAEGKIAVQLACGLAAACRWSAGVQ